MNKQNNRSKPKVSIVTAVRNSESEIEKTILSVLNQSYKNIDYIIIDGASTDGTLDIIKRYQSKLKMWRSEPDRGTYDAMNKGIKLAKGELIGLLNAGDWYEPKTVEWVVEAYLEHREVDIFYGNSIYYLEGKALQRKARPFTGLHSFINTALPHPTYFITKRLYEKQLYDLNYPITADYKFTIQALKSGAKTHIINHTLTHITAGGLSSSYGKPLLKGFFVKVKMLKERFQARKELHYNSVLNYLKLSFDYAYALLSLIKRTLLTIHKRFPLQTYRLNRIKEKRHDQNA
jgi:glycosyltransferase involved in cell wall biosynthesis